MQFASNARVTLIRSYIIVKVHRMNVNMVLICKNIMTCGMLQFSGLSIHEGA